MVLNERMRELWEQHIMWTRSFIMSTALGSDDLDAVTKRLLRNPSDFADVLKRFYGAEKADKFKTLFEQHLLIAADLVNNAKAGNAKGVEDARVKWYKNADDITTFMASINPYWNKKELQMMFNEHLKMTEEEAVAILNKKYPESIELYDEIEKQALKMSDYLSAGLHKQFRF